MPVLPAPRRRAIDAATARLAEFGDRFSTSKRRYDELPAALAQLVHADDLVVTMGAGSIGAVAAELPTTLAAARIAPAGAGVRT